MTDRTGWQGLIDSDEEILWQGQPHSTIAWAKFFSPLTLMGAFFTGFSLFWMSAAASMTGGGRAPAAFQFFPLFGLPFFLVGLWMLGGRVIWDAFLRSRTYYTVTSRQVFIARNSLGKRTLESHNIRDIHRIVLQDGQPGSVLFNGVASGRGRNTGDRPGLWQIDDARHVYGILRQAQRTLRDQTK